MKNLVFEYKKWYCRGIFLSNICIPIFILLSAAGDDNLATLGASNTLGTIMASIGVVLFLTLGLIYIKKTQQEWGALAHFIKNDKDNLTRLIKGLLLFFLSWNLLLACAIFKLLKEDISILKWVSYALVAATAVIGVISNVYLNQYEIYNYFKLFREKYQDEMIPEIIKDIDKRKLTHKGIKARK